MNKKERAELVLAKMRMLGRKPNPPTRVRNFIHFDELDVDKISISDTNEYAIGSINMLFNSEYGYLKFMFSYLRDCSCFDDNNCECADYCLTPDNIIFSLINANPNYPNRFYISWFPKDQKVKLFNSEYQNLKRPRIHKAYTKLDNGKVKITTKMTHYLPLS